MSTSFDTIKNKADIVRQIDLVTVLGLTGSVKDKSDKAKWHTPQGTISICGPKFMNWTKGVGGGGAIDLVMHLKDFDFKTAVLWLAALLPSYHTQNSLKTKPQPNLQLPQKDNLKVPQVVNYLLKVRSIPLSLIRSLIHSGKLYADTKENAVFLLLGKEKRIVGAELRGTNHIIWHGMARGSRKDLGFFCIKSSHPRKIILCKSAIDAISFFTLYPNCFAISTSGATPNPVWLKSLINMEYEIYCGFDSDETGETIAQKMMTLYPGIKRLRPQKHDWNEVLISKQKNPSFSLSR